MTRLRYGALLGLLVLIVCAVAWLWQDQPQVAEPAPQGAPAQPDRVVPDDGKWLEAVAKGERVVLVDPKTEDELADLRVPDALPPLTPAERAPLEEFLSVSLRDALEEWEYVKKEPPDAKDHSLRLAEAQRNLEGARAKMNALLQGSYVVLPVDEQLPLAFWRHPDIHLVSMTAGREDGTPITVWLMVHFSRAPAFREAWRVYGMELRARAEAAVGDFNALPPDRRELLLPYVGRTAAKRGYPAGVTDVEQEVVRRLRKAHVRAVGRAMIELVH